MVDSFKQGYAYEDVNFEEYVIINTKNKDNPDNGKIFRRGSDYLNESTYEYYPEQKCKIDTNG